jgi:hypothetical protein
MTPNYLLAIFHWRDHAGDLDDPQARASMESLLWGCQRWLELNPTALDTLEGQRLLMIKRELEDWLERHEKLPSYRRPPSSGPSIE